MLPIFTWETSSQGPVTIDIHLWFHVVGLWRRDALIMLTVMMLLQVFDGCDCDKHWHVTVCVRRWEKDECVLWKSSCSGWLRWKFNHRSNQSIIVRSIQCTCDDFTMDLTSWCSSQSSKFVLLSPMLITITVMEHTCSIIIMTVNIIKHHDLRVLKYYIFFSSQSIDMFHSITMQCTGFQTITSHHITLIHVLHILHHCVCIAKCVLIMFFSIWDI